LGIGEDSRVISPAVSYVESTIDLTADDAVVLLQASPASAVGAEIEVVAEADVADEVVDVTIAPDPTDDPAMRFVYIGMATFIALVVLSSLLALL